MMRNVWSSPNKLLCLQRCKPRPSKVNLSLVSSSLGPADLHFRDRGGRAGIFMPRQIHAHARLLVPAILLAALFPAPFVWAEARITGNPDAVRVEARNAPVEEVMAALGTSFGLRYRSTVSSSRRITGTYEGSLQRVVTRLLDGYNFVMKTSPGGVEVMVYGVVKPGEAAAQDVTPLDLGKTPSAETKSRRQERRKRRAN